LLGKVYITENKFEQANHAFYQVVNSNQYALVNDFGFYFPGMERRKTAMNLFSEIQHKTYIENGRFVLMDCCYPECQGIRGAGGWGLDTPTQDLFK